jgi:hypothetical protein
VTVERATSSLFAQHVTPLHVLAFIDSAGFTAVARDSESLALHCMKTGGPFTGRLMYSAVAVYQRAECNGAEGSELTRQLCLCVSCSDMDPRTT